VHAHSRPGQPWQHHTTSRTGNELVPDAPHDGMVWPGSGMMECNTRHRVIVTVHHTLPVDWMPTSHTTQYTKTGRWRDGRQHAFARATRRFDVATHRDTPHVDLTLAVHEMAQTQTGGGCGLKLHPSPRITHAHASRGRTQYDDDVQDGASANQATYLTPPTCHNTTRATPNEDQMLTRTTL